MSPQYTQMIIFILMITEIALLFAQGIICDTAYECVGTNWTLSSDQNIYGRGYKSLSGPSTSITNNYTYTFIRCYGAYSCAEILFILSRGNVECLGSHSCHNSKMINANNYLGCYGSNSCSNSNINSKNGISCEGDQSCNYANISSPIIYAEGSYSLYGSTIDTNFIADGILTIYLRGYQSGFRANIICRSGDMCNIYCYFNGCQMLYVICEDGNNCDITLNSNDSSITIPPIHNKNDFDDSMYDLKYINYKTDALCNDPSNIFVYDDYQQQEGVNINISNGGPVCCRGWQSCGYNGAIQFTAATTSDILVCSASYSCYSTSIITKGETFCEGSHSCYHTNIYGSDNVYCLGNMACSQSVITESKNIYCSASYACHDGQIESNGTNVNIYLLGYYSGIGLRVYCEIGDECVIRCGAHQSCLVSTTILDCNNNCVVYCNDDTGCPAGNYTMITLRSPTYPPSNAPSSSPTACPDYDISMLILILILCVFQF